MPPPWESCLGTGGTCRPCWDTLRAVFPSTAALLCLQPLARSLTASQELGSVAQEQSGSSPKEIGGRQPWPGLKAGFPEEP